MDWGVKYIGYFYSEGLGQCYIHIHKKDFVGESKLITLTEEGINITVDSKEYYEPIISTSAEIKIVNDKDNFYELDALFTISDNEYMVLIGAPYAYLFRGYIPCEIVEQVWLKRGIVTLNATCNLNRLSEYKPTILDNPGLVTLMDLIQHCLSFTGLDLMVYVNISRRYIQPDPPNSIYNTCFDQVYIDTDLFYEDTTTLKDCKFILESILKSYGCIIYYFNDKWYIERVRDLGVATKHYVIYDAGSYSNVQDISLSYFTFGTELKCCNAGQTIRYCPGLHSIEVTKNEKRRNNYVQYYFENISAIEPLNLLEYASGGNMEWSTILDNTITWVAFRNLYGILRGVAFDNNYPDYNSPPPLPRIYIDPNYPEYDDINYRVSLIGLYTSFTAIMNATTTSITISYKFKIPQTFLDAMESAYPGWKNRLITNPEDNKFYARFFIKQLRGGGFYFLHFNSTTSSYEFKLHTDIVHYGGVFDPGIIEVEIPFSDFTNRENYSHEFSKIIELDQDGSSAITSSFTLGVCQIGFISENEIYKLAVRDLIVGDIFVVVNDTLDDNIIIGTINNDFVKVQQETIDIFDSSTDSVYRIYTSPDRDYWISLGWGGLTLVQQFIQDRFQIYNKVRREIISDMISLLWLKPFTLVDNVLPIYCVGTVQTYGKYVIGTGTDFTTDFQINDYIIVEGFSPNKILDINLDPDMWIEIDPNNPHFMYVQNSFGNGASEKGLLYYKKGNPYYINGYKYCPNKVADIYYNMSLKEYISEDNIT
jgi:hypothetical protein